MKNPIFFIRKIYKNKTFKSKKWTSEEDKIISEEGILCNNKADWLSLSQKLNKRSVKGSIKRYKEINPKIKKGRWSKEEDKMLLDLIEKYGFNWKILGDNFTSRNIRQLRNRYEYCLNPALKKKKFSKEDDELMKQLYKNFGNKWSMYLNYFPFSTRKEIKSRFMKKFVYQ